jgi:ribosomal protein L29
MSARQHNTKPDDKIQLLPKEKLKKELSECRKALHRERQKNRETGQSRNKYKIKGIVKLT